jgi:hypothetical protein
MLSSLADQGGIIFYPLNPKKIPILKIPIDFFFFMVVMRHQGNEPNSIHCQRV